ncbi:hypothetical protein WUBG_09868, partial [Wuchereria bancrofti]
LSSKVTCSNYKKIDTNFAYLTVRDVIIVQDCRQSKKQPSDGILEISIFFPEGIRINFDNLKFTLYTLR